MKTISARALAATAALGLVLGPIVGAGAAEAHVTARTSGMGSEGFGVVTFVVPNESDTAATTALTVSFPAVKHLFPEGKSGWTTHVTKNPQGEVTAIGWTADPGTPGIPVGQFSEFNVAGGPFTGTVALPATQVYGDGKVVKWDQNQAPGADEPEHPSPTISPAAVAAAPSDTTARWLGGLGLLAGAVGIVVGAAGLRGRRDNGTVKKESDA